MQSYKTPEGECAMNNNYDYVIVGGGLSGASAIKGIREIDKRGTIALIGEENDPPYDRPPLSKKLWFNKVQVEDIFLNKKDFYTSDETELLIGTRVTGIDTENKLVITDGGGVYSFGKLLLATGGKPRTLTIPGWNLPEVIYYRTLADYRRLRIYAAPGKSALIIGGGFIGTEVAAALSSNKVDVTMIFPESYFVQNVFTESLGNHIVDSYKLKGVKVITEDIPASLEKKHGRILAKTKKGKEIHADFVVAGIGITPSTDLAKAAGLSIDNGIVVNDQLASSHPDIFAAGDVCNFESIALSKRMRVEHWDNALTQGRIAGRNMAGANDIFDYVPYFFSDLFEFGYESAGDINSSYETHSVWQEENKTGIIYYIKNKITVGAMLCNVWGKIDTARELIRARKQFSSAELDTAIRF